MINKNNLIAIDPIKPVVDSAKPTAVDVKPVKPTAVDPVKPTVVDTKPKFTQEEEIVAVGVVLAIVAAVWMIYK